MSDTASILHGLELNEERFVGLLRNLIGEVEHLQNTGVGTAYVPQEDLAIKHCLEVLAPYRIENGGPLEIEHVTFVEGRGNLIICLLYTSPSPRDVEESRMPSSA